MTMGKFEKVVAIGAPCAFVAALIAAAVIDGSRDKANGRLLYTTTQDRSEQSRLSTHHSEAERDASSLSDLDAACSESGDEIVELIALSYSCLLNDGVTATPKEMDEVLHRAARAVRGSNRQHSFKLMMAAYCTVRESGKSHQEAMGCFDDWVPLQDAIDSAGKRTH